MNCINKKHSITNTSDKYLLVGNCHEIIAAYDTADEANADINNKVPSIEDSPWGVVQILSPADSISGEYSQMIPKTASQKAEIVSLLAMPWSL
jgi:hypothetical protein